MTYEFTTEVDTNQYYISEYFGLKSTLDIPYKTKSKVQWYAEAEVREWGIKSFYPTVKRITTEIEYEIYLEELEEGDKEKLTENLGENRTWIDDEKISGILTLDIDAYSKEWKIIEEFGWTESGNLSPDDCEIDFRSKKITIA